ncbi:high-potential iron-sulfur protein [Marinomonas atlantica]|uniref:high-potential iron-sulfur protein n=1 Tax=Marinomonas atlantica TaxID=1806668 RepID=UPI000835113F|nr:high-potential iron-sulfur protein [Marinomonas atlantica]MCO4786124.1 high-potential iron-sulfur protein [Marinomonas atlantica]
MIDSGRRKFVKKGLFGLAALPFGMGALTSNAFAALPMLDPSAPNAKALAYVPDAASAASHAAFKEGSACSNCNFYNAGSGACPLFAGHAVEANGWCQAWVKKP